MVVSIIFDWTPAKNSINYWMIEYTVYEEMQDVTSSLLRLSSVVYQNCKIKSIVFIYRSCALSIMNKLRSRVAFKSPYPLWRCDPTFCWPTFCDPRFFFTDETEKKYFSTSGIRIYISTIDRIQKINIFISHPNHMIEK